MIEFQPPFEADYDLATRDVWVTVCGEGRMERHKSRFEKRTRWYAMKNTEDGWRPIELHRNYRTKEAAIKILERHLDGKPPLKRTTKAQRAIRRRRK